MSSGRTAPSDLDPARIRTEVTRDIAETLGRLAQALETRHSADRVSSFLMRRLFCMFAQSADLPPSRTAFTDILARCRGAPEKFVGLVGDLWRQLSIPDARLHVRLVIICLESRTALA